MNSEIEQMSSIVISARKALYEDSDLDFTEGEFVSSIRFIFAKKHLFSPSLTANSVYEWFETCKKRGLVDIKLFLPTASDQRHLLGFANTSSGLIVCYFKNGSSSLFQPAWNFDFNNKCWDVIYIEQKIINITKENLNFTDKTEEFKDVLSDIGNFAEEIGFPYFSDVFQKAKEALCDNNNIELNKIPHALPAEFKGIYYAIETADVFGAMGSWNDSPSYYAEKNRCFNEYNVLSDRLLYQIRYHLMYVSNECWK